MDEYDGQLADYIDSLPHDELKAIAYRCVQMIREADDDIGTARAFLHAIKKGNTSRRRVEKGFRRAAIALAGIAALLVGGFAALILVIDHKGSAAFDPLVMALGAALGAAVFVGGLVWLIGWIIAGFFKEYPDHT